MKRTASFASSAVLALWILLAGGCAPQKADLYLGPYVNHVNESSAKVLWITSPSAPESRLVLDQGRVDANVRVAIEIRTIPEQKEILHVATISGLQAGRAYRYDVIDSAGAIEGTFRTAPPKGSAGPLRFVVYGDTRTFPDRHRAVATAIDREMPLDFIVNSGDLAANGEVWDLWKKEFFDPAADLLRHVTLWPVRGNHEMGGDLCRAIFDLPNAGVYYSFDYGNVHVVVLDSELAEHGADPDMLKWLEKDLAANKAQWKIVSYHRPTFDTVSHRTAFGQTDLLPVLEKGGVDMVVNGHTHNYQRFRPIGPEGGAPNRDPSRLGAPGKPIIHVVSGGGGAPTYPFNPSPILEKAYAGIHYCLFNVEGNTLEMTAKRPDGKVIDQLKLVKRGGMYQKEVMDRAVTTAYARDVQWLLTGFYGDFTEKPVGGATVKFRAFPYNFPEGATVEISQPAPRPPEPNMPRRADWTVPTVTLTGWKGGTDINEDDPYLPPAGPIYFTATAPPYLRTGIEGFRPGLAVNLRVTYNGQVYTNERASVLLYSATVRKLVPEPVAVSVPRAPAAFAIDGNLADWKDVPFLWLPVTGAPSRNMKIAWRPEGLYGALTVRDANLVINLKDPWDADCLEMFIEGNYGRSFDARTNRSALKCELYPQPAKGSGPAGAHVSYGRLKDRPEGLKAAWTKTADGYALEFLVPAEALSRSELAAGKKMGFHYLVHDEGRILERFVDTRGKAEVFRMAIHWGAIHLAE